MDYSKWKTDQMLVTNIYLDPLNPRIPPTDFELDERTLIADLVYHDNVAELARSIATNGYFPTESLIVIKESSKTVVIEGNRRVAALKLLINPEAGPEDQIVKFRAISNRIDINAIKRVKVIIAPSREAAAPILMSKHTQPQIAAWKPVMKASFYYRLLKNGISIDDLSNEYGVSIKDIKRHVRLYKMYQIACNLGLPDEIAQIVQNPREFNATTLERIWVHNIGLDFLGISFDENDNVIGKIHEDEFKKGYKKIVIDVANEKINSRTIQRTEDIKKYFNSFSEKEKPDQSKQGKFTTKSILGLSEDDKISTATQKKTSRRRIKPKPIGLIPSAISCDVNNQRINNVFDELKTLPVAKYPNATAVLFRSLLEMSLCHYLEARGEIKAIKEEKAKRAKNDKYLKKDWQPTLNDMLGHLVSPKCKIIMNPNIIKVINKFLSEKDELLSHDSLNYFVHNQFYSPNEETLRRFWMQLEGLFQIILIEPEID